MSALALLHAFSCGSPIASSGQKQVKIADKSRSLILIGKTPKYLLENASVWAPMMKNMAEGNTMSEKTLTVDGIAYNIADLSDNARAQVANINFCDAQIQQLRNEWAVADTARLGYAAALKRELAN